MQFQQLRAFREVATELNFTRAARNLHYAQSTVTAQVRNLEETVGAPLFDRSGRQVTLTAAGRCLLPYAEHLIRTAETACREAMAASLQHPPRRAAHRGVPSRAV